VSNQVTGGSQVALGSTPISGGGTGLSPTGTINTAPTPTGSSINSPAIAAATPVRRLGDLVTPRNEKGLPDEHGSFLQPGASTIHREQGQRLIAIKFEVRNRDLASAVAEARSKVDPILHAPYRAEWSGEFQEMEDAEKRLARVFGVALILIALFLYL